MVRAKVQLKYIENDSARRTTYQKRVKSLMKQTQELSILCGIDACTLVYGPYTPSPVVSPPTEPEARPVLLKYKERPEMERAQNKFDQEAYLRERVTKSEEKLKRLQRKNTELEMENLMIELLSGKPIEQIPFVVLEDLIRVVDYKVRAVQHRIAKLGVSDMAVVGPSGSGSLPVQGQPSPSGPSQFPPGPAPEFQAGPSNQHQP